MACNAESKAATHYNTFFYKKVKLTSEVVRI